MIFKEVTLPKAVRLSGLCREAKGFRRADYICTEPSYGSYSPVEFTPGDTPERQ
jgi:hypothetical protein